MRRLGKDSPSKRIAPERIRIPIQRRGQFMDLQWDRNFALEQAGEDEELLAELLLLFLESSKTDLAKILAGTLKHDCAAVADAAHSIKGAAASLGVEGLRVQSSSIEMQGRRGVLPSAADLTGLEAMVQALADLC